jgi:co-chaperonin GroES (HSP10)
MNIQPMHDRVLLERLPAPQTRIVITDAEKHRKFKVLAVGPKCKEVKPKDVVVLPGVASDEPDHSERNMIIVREGDIGWKIG